MERLAGPLSWFLIKFYKIFSSCQTVSRTLVREIVPESFDKINISNTILFEIMENPYNMAGIPALVKSLRERLG